MQAVLIVLLVNRELNTCRWHSHSESLGSESSGKELYSR